MESKGKIRILVIGVGNMGESHARSYHKMADFDLVGLVARSDQRKHELAKELGNIKTFSDYRKAFEDTKPDAVSINTYPDTHEEIAVYCLKNGSHVFLEKPMATTVEGAKRIKAAALKHNRKLVIGYILRHHPSWSVFTELAQTLGKPLVMRMNLNQQSSGKLWNTHKQLMKSMSPIVDCGVHYVDVMCQMTRSKPVSVFALGARLTEEIADSMYNYGMLQVAFEDGSVGWYESGWGPMMSKTAYFVKDVIGPLGSVSIAEPDAKGSVIEDHVKTAKIILHHVDTDKKDEVINTEEEPDHQGLCDLEQAYFLRAIREDIALNEHMQDGINSLAIVLAADRSIREKTIVKL